MKKRRTAAAVLTAGLMAGLMMGSSFTGCAEKGGGIPVPKEQNGGNSPVSARHEPYDGAYPYHEPYGRGIGAVPGRVVWDYNPDSVEWDGNGYWWETEHFDEAVLLQMVNESIASLGGKETVKDGWKALFSASRQSRGKDGTYVPGEKIAIKANINGSGVYDDDASGKTQMSYTNPVLLKALLLSLVQEGGVNPEDITVYDVSRIFPEYMVEMCTEGKLKGIHFVGRNHGTADEGAAIQWSHSFSGKVNYLPTCVTEASYVINLANLKGHSYGITLCGKNHFGSFINGNALRPPEGANLHQWLTRSEMGIYSPLTDLMANADLGGKTVLYMLDAVICAPGEGASITGDNSRWRQAPFNGDYTSSIFVSQDPVAIDSVGADFLINEPVVTENNSAVKDISSENYLHEAGLAAAAPSGTVYTDNQGHTVSNLGVHEHWNNSAEKLYSRNLGKTEGIELVKIGTQEGEKGKALYYGDVDEDAAVTSDDALAVLKHTVKMETLQGQRILELADINKDDVIDVDDALEILKTSVGLKEPVLYSESGDIPENPEEGPGNNPETPPVPGEGPDESDENVQEKMTMKITVGDTVLTAEFAENSSAEALRELLKEGPLTIDMSDYGNFEKVGPIGTSLPRNDEYITTEPGDIILYQGNSLTIYYDTNSWNFTRVGKIKNVTQEELKAVLGQGDVTVTFSLK